MGKVVEKKREKKKGRPSLLDLQKRSLKEHSQSQGRDNSASKPSQNYGTSTPTPLRRSTRRNTARDGASSPDEHDGEDSSPGRRRREKKLKLVLKLPNSSPGHQGESDSVAEDDGDASQDQKKRKIAAIGDGSGPGVSSEKGEKPSKPATSHQGTQPDSEVSTPLPDKKLLLFILDRIQKKDTYGVFSEPVDPEELPDYHDIIEHPMDFGTVRKKLNGGAYANLEQFENDVFLICSNAMQYNSLDTVYFRQARSMQELARKNFDNLRQDSDDNEPGAKVVRRGRPPTKHLKRPPGRPPLDRAGSSDGTLATGGEKTMPANFDLRKGPFSADKLALLSSPGRLRNHDVNSSWLSGNRFGRNDEYAGSSLRGNPMKLGNKQTVPDENRRDTYKHCHPSTLGRKSSVLATFGWQRKQLMAVGLQSDHGYARSLARFAANLGPVAWKVASKMIERSLPAGVKFGPGWVGENDVLPKRQFQLPSLAPSSLCCFSSPGSSGSKDTDRHYLDLKDDSVKKPEEEHYDPLEKHPPLPPPSGTLPKPITKGTEAVEGSKSIRPHLQMRSNGFTSPCGYNDNLAAAHIGKMIGAKHSSGLYFHPKGSLEAESTAYTNSLHREPTGNINPEDPGTSPNNLSHGGSSLSQQKPELEVPHQPRPESAAPDLNIRFHSPGSPNSTRNNSAQPDLALQL